MKPYPAHPYAEIFPLRSDQSLIDLSDNIKEKGQRERIVLLDRQILAGRRRQLACIRAGIEPLYRAFGSRPEDGTDPLEFAFSDYYRRDDVTQAEKAIAATNYSNLKRGDNQHSKEKEVSSIEPTSKSQKQAAEKFGVPVSTIKRTKKILDKGTPELQEAMRTEQVSVSDAAAIADESPDVQRQAVKDIKSGKAKTLRGAVQALTGPAPEVPAMIARDLGGLIERLTRVETEQAGARDLACDGLRSALAIIQRL